MPASVVPDIAMSCDCSNVSATTEAERRTLRIALALNTTMCVAGITAGVLAQSVGVLADGVDMMADAAAYALALLAVRRGLAFKRNAARFTGATLLFVGLGILGEVGRRWLYGSEPVGTVMVAYAVVAFAVNVYVLALLTRHRDGEVHLRATYICTRADVLANIAVFASGVIVMATGARLVDLVVGLLIGVYVLSEVAEIFRDARRVGNPGCNASQTG